MCPLCFIVGIGMMVGAYMKPRYFWLSTQVLLMRRRLGDQGAAIFYYCLGGGITSYGVSLLF